MFAIYFSDCFLQGLCTVQMPSDNHCFFHALAHQIQRWNKRNQAASNLKIGALIGLQVHFNETNTVHILVNQDAHDMESLRKTAANHIRGQEDTFKEFFDEALEVISYDLINLCGILNLAL
jgi:hypothetical protein